MMYRIEHIDNTTTGICELCKNYNVITLEKLEDKNVYVCDTCRVWIEKDIFGTINPLVYFHTWIVL
jgi:hypothetical protein